MTRGDGRFDVAMRHATIGMAIIAPDGSFLEVNPALCAMLGRTEAEMLAASWQELTHPDDLEVDVALAQELLDGRRESYRLAKRYLRPDGAEVFGDLSVGCVRDDSGAVEFFVSQIVDQTERELAGETLARTEARYGAALSAKRDPHVFLDAVRGDDGTIVDFVYADANAAALGWLGRTLEELQERSLLTAFPSHRATGMFDAYVRTVETGEQLVEDERRLRSEILGTDAWFDFRGIKVLDGLSLSWRDVTTKVKTRNEIAEADERHRLLAENASDVVFRVFADGTVDWVVGSVAELLGRNDDDIRGHSALDLFVAEDLGDLEGTGVRLRHGETVVDTVRVMRPDGTHRWVSRRMRAVMADDGEHAAWYVLAISDAQAQVENQRALEESERQAKDLAQRYARARNEALDASREKTVFLSRMSHELRTPLNAILGFAQLLAMDELTVDQADAVHQIRTGGRHLLELISEVLDISRIESGRLSLSMESVAVADAVNEALDLVRPLADAVGVTVGRVDGAACVAQVWADRQRVIQVLLNLLSNGVKYNHRGGTVEVFCEPLPGELMAIRVRDSGPGLSADQIGHIFDPFDRLGAERTDIEGTGIGLTLSEALARLMSGRLEVSSEPGVGSVFSLLLPSSALPTGDIGVGEVEEVTPTLGGTAHVLYVEDNPANTHLMERIAGLRSGVRLTLAPNGALGLDAARQDTPDLVLLDLHLPDMRGETVLSRLREMPGMHGVRIVVVTADASAGLAQRLTGLGADAVLTKPIDVGEVLGWFDRTIGGSGS